MVGRSRDCLVSIRHGIAVLITELGEAKAVELVRVWVYLFIRIDSIDREPHHCIRRDGHAIGEREGT